MEVWKEIPGAPDYMVSNLGRVKSLARVAYRFNPRWNCDSPITIREKFLRPGNFYGADRKGRKRPKPAALTVALYIDTISTTKYVHHLVLEAFVGPKPAGMEACHKDGDGTNNALENLRWDSHAENVKDSIRHGTFYPKLRGRKAA